MRFNTLFDPVYKRDRLYHIVKHTTFKKDVV